MNLQQIMSLSLFGWVDEDCTEEALTEWHLKKAWKFYRLRAMYGVEISEEALYQHASKLYLLATPRTLDCTIHLSNNNVLSHDTSSIIALKYLSPVLPNFSCLVSPTRI